MRKLVLVLIAVIALAFTGQALAGNGSTGASGHHGPGQSIAVAGKTVQLNLLDLGDPGFTLGDQIAFSDDLLNKADGKPVGFDGGACTLIRVTDADKQSGTALCQVTYSLPGGQITTQGLLTLTNGGFVGTQVAAITGGTERYDRARGESRLEFVRPGELSITLELR